MWYVYEEDNYYIAARGEPQTSRAWQDCIAGPLTREEVLEWHLNRKKSIIWR